MQEVVMHLLSNYMLNYMTPLHKRATQKYFKSGLLKEKERGLRNEKGAKIEKERKRGEKNLQAKKKRNMQKKTLFNVTLTVTSCVLFVTTEDL